MGPWFSHNWISSQSPQRVGRTLKPDRVVSPAPATSRRSAHSDYQSTSLDQFFKVVERYTPNVRVHGPPGQKHRSTVRGTVATVAEATSANRSNRILTTDIDRLDRHLQPPNGAATSRSKIARRAPPFRLLGVAHVPPHLVLCFGSRGDPRAGMIIGSPHPLVCLVPTRAVALFGVGKCNKGASCPFAHVAVEDGDAPSTSTSNNRKQKKKKKKHNAEDDNGSAIQNGLPSQIHEPLDRPASSDTPAKTKKSKSKNRKSKDAATETETVEEQSPTRAELSAILSALRKHAECTQSNLSEMNDILIQFGAKYAETQRAVNDLKVEILGLEAKMNQGQHKGPPVAVAGSTGERKQENDTSTSDVSDANGVMSTPARACTTSSNEIEGRAAPPDPKFAHSTNGNSSVAAPQVPTSVGTPINIKPMNIEQKAPLPRSAENQTVNGGAPKTVRIPRPETC
ncbi:hypothetical protein THAOC_01093, partial [Thalassiosira oceanica]